MTCVMVFPASTPLDQKCVRCGDEAGNHPAPLSLLVKPGQQLKSGDLPVTERPSLRSVLTEEK